MSQNPPDESTRRSPSGGPEIPRRGYDRRRETGSSNPPPTTPEATPPPYTAPPLPNMPPPVYGEPAPRYGPRPGSPPPPMRGRHQGRLPRDSGLYLPWWSLVILIVFVGVAALGLLMIVMNLSTITLANQTPQVIVISPLPEGGNPNPGNFAPPSSVPSATASLQVILPTVAPTRTALPGGCLLNQEVVVFGTGAVGLNLRAEPRLSGERLWIAREGDVLKVVDGPQYFDDIEWCKVESITRPGQVGWGAIDYMIAADAAPTADGQ